MSRIPANQVDLRAGSVVYGRDGLRGIIDHVKGGRQHASVSWDDGSGHDRISISKLAVERPTSPAPQPQWAQALQRSAEAQVRLPEMRRFKRQGLAGALLLAALVSALTGNIVLLVVLVIGICLMPVAGPRR